MNFPTTQSKFGEALQSIGQLLPELMRQKRQDARQREIDKKKSIADDIANRTLTLDLENKTDTAERTKGVRSEIDRIVGDIERRNTEFKSSPTGQLYSEMKDVPLPKDAGLTAEERRADMKMRAGEYPKDNSLYSDALASNEIMRNADLPVTKEIMNTLETREKLEKEKEKAASGIGGTNVWSKKDSYYRQTPGAIESLRKQIETMHKLPEGHPDKLSDMEYDLQSRRVETDPASADIYLETRLGKPATAEATLVKTMDEKGKTSYITSSASAQGKEAAEQSFLTGTTIPGLEPLPGVRQTEESINAVKKAKPMMDNLRSLTKQLIDKYAVKGVQPIGKDAAEYETLVRQIQLLAKDATFNLGVLNGPDLGLLEQMIANPASFKTSAAIARYGMDNVGVRLNSLDELFNMRESAFYNTNGFKRASQKHPAPQGGNTPPKAPPSAQPSASIPTVSSKDQFDKLPSGAEYINAKTGKRGRKP